ncbi:MAG: basic secretory protein-like protein, partial [Planctomycetia bacterium]|nr:basic secretory protein-like protein [Planctomycetia bacterium]
MRSRYTWWITGVAVALMVYGDLAMRTLAEDPLTTENPASISEFLPETTSPTAVAFHFEYDGSSPELRQWVTETLEPICAKWYPELVAMLPSEGYTAPQEVRIVFQPGEGVAYTQGTTVTCLSPWFDANLQGEAAGAVIHELVHVVQRYPQGRGRNRNPSWLVEGLTDYIRWFLYEPVVRPIRIDPDRSHYTDSYQVIVTLNAAMREGRYNEDFWRERTDRTVDELWSEFTDSLRSPGKRGNLAETVKKSEIPEPSETTTAPGTASGAVEVPRTSEPAWTVDPAGVLERMAIRYLKLALETGEHDPDFVDAYYGPSEWREEAKSAHRDAATIQRDVESLLAELRTVGEVLRRSTDSEDTAEPSTLAELMEMIDTASPRSPSMLRLRQRFLESQCVAMRTRLRIVQNDPPSFDDEVRLVYDTAAPVHPEEFFNAINRQLALALPAPEDEGRETGGIADHGDGDGNGDGDGGSRDTLESLRHRYQRLASKVVIPEEKYDTVFRMAIFVARQRARDRIPTLPWDETFEVKYVRGAPWGAYAWYQGNFRTRIEVNLRSGLTIDSPVDLATHEGYPGHHVYYSLVELNLVRRCGWMEHSLMALFSPQAILAEGAACLAPQMAFPGEEELQFERDILAPIAGLN